MGNILEDIPQLVIQALAASNTLDTITLLSMVASVLTISSGIIKPLILFLVAKYQGMTVGGSQKQGNEGKDENNSNGEWSWSTAYTTMDAGIHGDLDQGNTNIRKGLSHVVQKWTTGEVVAWLEERNFGSVAVLFVNRGEWAKRAKRAVLFERIAHMRLQRGRDFDVRRLDGKRAVGILSLPPNSPRESFSNITEVKLYLDSSSGFPGMTEKREENQKKNKNKNEKKKKRKKKKEKRKKNRHPSTPPSLPDLMALHRANSLRLTGEYLNFLKDTSKSSVSPLCPSIDSVPNDY